MIQNQPTEVSHRQIWQLAWPMILANISIPLLGMVDTAVVGHLDSAHFLGAVAISTLIFSFLFWGFGFLRMATTGQTAQAIGQDDKQRSLQILVQSLGLAFLLSVLLLLLQKPLSQLAFQLIDSSDSVSLSAQTYFDIRIWSAPAILANYVVLGWLIGLAKTRLALLLVLIVNITNIFLDLLLVNYFNMNVDGVALASVIAEYLGLASSYFLIRKQGFRFEHFKSKALSKQSHFLASITLHGNIFIRTLCLLFSFAFFTSQGAKQGDTILAANAVLLNFITFMAFVLDGFANAVEVITGRTIGQNNQGQLKKGLIYTALWALSMALLFSVFYLFFGSYLISLLTSIPEIVSHAEDYLIWLVIAPVIGVWSYLFDGLFIGATRSAEMRNTMLFSTFFCYLPAWYFLQPFDNHGLWLALLVFLAARGLSQARYIPAIIKQK